MTPSDDNAGNDQPAQGQESVAEKASNPLVNLEGPSVSLHGDLHAQLNSAQLESWKGFSSELAVARVLPVINPLRELRETLASVSPLFGLREQLAMLRPLAWKEAFGLPLAGVQALPSLEGIRAQLEPIQALVSSSGLVTANVFPSMEGLRAQLAEMRALPSLKGFQAHLEATQVFSSAAGFQAQLSAVKALPSIAGLTAELKFLSAQGRKFSSAFEGVFASYDNVIKSSSLARLLVAESAERTLQSLEELLAHSQPDPVDRVDDERAEVAEEEIVDLLSRGGQLTQLSKQAFAQILNVWRVLKWLAGTLVFLVGVAQAYEYLEKKLEGVTSAQQVQDVIKELPSEHRALLASYRVVIREQAVLRAGPGSGSDETGRLHLGDRVEVLEERDGWIKVSVDLDDEETEGWLSRSRTAPIADKTQA
ncbi:SH3 domain-containing protein [Pseudomonas sp. GZD-209]|uniref:SH3 domain-containing protein n=1 Tax=Pseudomonas sp. GZD-209 TaxID=3404807 RepID=UPI003BB671EB